MLGPDYRDLVNPLAHIGSELALQKKYDRARSYLERALAILEKSVGPKHPDVAPILTKLGRAFLGLLDPRRAAVPLERALAIMESHSGDPIELAETQIAMARALEMNGRERKRAFALAVSARETYAAAGEKHQTNVAEVDAWLARRRMSRR